MGARSESWFDRLAARRTRREALKAGAAGVVATVAAGLPFAASPSEVDAAPNPSDCRKGCVFTANQRYASSERAESGSYGLNVIVTDGGLILYGFVLQPIIAMVLNDSHRRHADEMRADHRLAVNNCFQPFCPGFDPHKPGGPCDGCEPPLYCNPCALVEPGYICCVYEPGDCHGDCCSPGTGC